MSTLPQQKRKVAPGAFARVMQPLLGLLWPFFLVCTVIVLAAATFGIGAAQIVDWIPGGTATGTLLETPPAPLESALIRILSASDAFWIILAAINIYLALVAGEGLATARRWAGIILAGSAILASAGAITGWPFGPLAYTDVLGTRIGHVLPFTIPLLWFVVVVGARCVWLRVFPRANQWQLALGVAALALLTDANLEPVAWKIRAYWIWYPLNLAPPWHPPWQNYVSWAGAAFAFSLALGENRNVVSRPEPALRPMAILLSMNLVFLVANLSRWLRP